MIRYMLIAMGWCLLDDTLRPLLRSWDKHNPLPLENHGWKPEGLMKPSWLPGRLHWKADTMSKLVQTLTQRSRSGGRITAASGSFTVAMDINCPFSSILYHRWLILFRWRIWWRALELPFCSYVKLAEATWWNPAIKTSEAMHNGSWKDLKVAWQCGNLCLWRITKTLHICYTYHPPSPKDETKHDWNVKKKVLLLFCWILHAHTLLLELVAVKFPGKV